MPLGPVRPLMMGRPLMVTPAAMARSRAPMIGSPLLFSPSPEMSMTRRAPLYGFLSRYFMLWSITLEIEVHWPRNDDPSDMVSAKSRASSSLAITVQSATMWWRSRPDHSTYITATRPRGPERMARRIWGLVMAVAKPSRCKRASSSSMLPETSTASTSSRSTSLASLASAGAAIVSIAATHAAHPHVPMDV